MTAIYVEGGGNANRILKTELRQAFRDLFIKAGFSGRLPKVIACGSRNEAFSDFKVALKNKNEGELILLLVDSEDVVKENSKWEHLKKRDHWDKPVKADEKNIHFMTVCMESWFLADIEGLMKFFGRGFNASKLKMHTNFENVTKKELYKELKETTKETIKGEYGKGQHSFKILKELDAQKIRAHGKYSKEFFDVLDN
jgi:hypothetical protein